MRHARRVSGGPQPLTNSTPVATCQYALEPPSCSGREPGRDRNRALGCLYPRAVPRTPSETLRESLIITPERIAAARERIRGKVHRTPILSSLTAARVIEAATGVRAADGTVYLKAETFQKAGSYKARGMVSKVSTLSAEERARGIITVSAGNAGAGYAYAGLVEGVPVTVVMPAQANPIKVAANVRNHHRCQSGGRMRKEKAADSRLAVPS